MEGLLIVTAIHPAHVAEAWHEAGPMVARALRHVPGRPDVLHRLQDGTAQLWAVIEDARPIAVVVTEITPLPDRRCRLWLVAGARTADWVRPFLAALEPWARACGCTGLWACGRAGWARLARRLGWSRDGSDAGFPRWSWRF